MTMNNDMEVAPKVDDEYSQPSTFEGVTTIGHLVDIGFPRGGDLIFKIRVPYRFRKSAIPLADAWNLPLDIRIQTWQLYSELRGDIPDEPE